MKNCTAHKGAANEITGDTRLGPDHASSVDAFQAVRVEALHVVGVAPGQMIYAEYADQSCNTNNSEVSSTAARRNENNTPRQCLLSSEHAEEPAKGAHSGVTLAC